MPCHRSPSLPTSTGPPHTHRAHEPSHFVCSICHVTPCPPHHPTQPLTDPLQQVQTTHSADRTKDKPFSASAASFSSPSPHTSRHLSEKKSPLKPKPVWGLDAGKRGLFCPCCPDTPASSTISAWLPPQPQTNVASLLTCYLKPVPRLAHGGFRLTSWSHRRAGGVPVPCAVPGAPTPAPASSVSDQPVY